MRLNITCSQSVAGSLLFKFDGTQAFTATTTTTSKAIAIVMCLNYNSNLKACIQ